MFVIFDSTNQIFDRLMKAKDEQKSGDDAKHAGYLKRFKHMSRQAIQSLFKNKKKSDLVQSNTFIYVRGDEISHYQENEVQNWIVHVIIQLMVSIFPELVRIKKTIFF